MDLNLAYWTGAFLNMGVVVGFAVQGVRARRRGAIALHRRNMLVAVCLVLLFVLSYAVKLALLGREDLESWTRADLVTLRLHELCVLSMVVSGGVAGWRGSRLNATRNVTASPDDPPAPPRLAAGHRLAGRVAVVAVVLGFVTAALVLSGMYRRAGLL